MKFITLIEQESLHLNSQKKVIPAEEFSTLLDASEVLQRTLTEEVAYRAKVAQEGEELKEKSKEEGFDAGLQRFNQHIHQLEEEIKKVRHDMEKVLVSLAIAGVKKIIGKELATQPEVIADIVATALKTVVHHRKIAVYVNQADLEHVEAERPRLKQLFEHLETLSISAREDVSPGGCIIETEAGIINAQLENQLKALEGAFQAFFLNHKKAS